MVEWDDKYSVDISIIDEEHKKFIDIINKAIVAKEHNGNPEEIKEVLNEITIYALAHFTTEEIYMIKFNYPEYQYHREEHLAFSIKTMTNLDKVIEGDCQKANEILESLKQWLINHIQGTDRKYVDYFKAHGLNHFPQN
ncbi:MAG: bacteriohemerythrin [Candidatus Scalindua sp.]